MCSFGLVTRSLRSSRRGSRHAGEQAARGVGGQPTGWRRVAAGAGCASRLWHRATRTASSRERVCHRRLRSQRRGVLCAVRARFATPSAAGRRGVRPNPAYRGLRRTPLVALAVVLRKTRAFVHQGTGARGAAGADTTPNSLPSMMQFAPRTAATQRGRRAGAGRRYPAGASTSVANSRSSVAAGSSVRPVWLGDGWMIVEECATTQPKRSEAGSAASGRRPDRPPPRRRSPAAPGAPRRGRGRARAPPDAPRRCASGPAGSRAGGRRRRRRR